MINPLPRQPPPRRRSLLGLLRPQLIDHSLPQQNADEAIKARVVHRRRSISLTTSLLPSPTSSGGGGGRKATEDEDLSVTTSSTCTSNVTTSSTTVTIANTIKKSVRFASKDKNEYYGNTQLCLEECQELWICRDEYKKLQRSLQFLATGLERAEKFAADNPSSYTNVLLYLYALCGDQNRACRSGSSSTENPALILSQDEMQELTQRLRLSSNRLGLERRIIPQFRQERNAQRRQMLQQIQQIQSLHHKNSNRKGSNNAKAAAHMRQACESISRPSRLFSLHMAHALAATL